MHRRLLMVSGAFDHVCQGLLPLPLPPSSRCRCLMAQPYHWAIQPSCLSVLDLVVYKTCDSCLMLPQSRVASPTGGPCGIVHGPLASGIDLPRQFLLFPLNTTFVFNHGYPRADLPDAAATFDSRISVAPETSKVGLLNLKTVSQRYYTVRF
jgi:hypothetical protein